MLLTFIKFWVLSVMAICTFIVLIALANVKRIQDSWDAVEKEEKDMEHDGE